MKALFSDLPCIQGARVTLRPLEAADAGALAALTGSPEVYQYLPTFLFEKKYADPAYVIERLYDECLADSLILGVFDGEGFCGLAEIYGYSVPASKVSVGNRFLPRCWGKRIATETLGQMVKYLFGQKEIKVITASSMLENRASAKVLEKNGFRRVAHGALENWGYPLPTLTDKWVRTADETRGQYCFHD